jgi:hypothetical protein
MNIAYKHLETKLKIGEFTVLQWAGIFAGIMAALAWGMYLSPFGAYLTLITAVYLAGVPVAASFLASVTAFDVALHLRALVRRRRMVGRFAPGPGDSARGYVLTRDDSDESDHFDTTNNLELDALWHA